MLRDAPAPDPHGLKSADPIPHAAALRALRRNPRWLVLANVVVFACWLVVSVGALGGYALEHIPNDTATIRTLEWVSVLVGFVALVACLLSMLGPKATVRRVNLVLLFVGWPAQFVLIWALWVAKF